MTSAIFIALFCAAVLGWWLTRLPTRVADVPGAPPLPSGRLAALWPDLESTGIAPLPEALEAFAARLALCDAARSEICAQYYLWRGDHSGTLLFEALLRAADRGVRVRLLLDDNATAGLDARLACLDAHPNIELRLFNPFPLRFPRLLGYLFDFPRLNRRMHNKMLIADGAAAILGGRNIGDEYFNDLSSIGLFMDMDVFVAGHAVRAAQETFETYWASEPAWPAERLIRQTPRRVRKGRNTQERALQAARGTRFSALLAESLSAADLGTSALSLHEAPVRLITDPPEKVLGRARKRHHLFPSLRLALGRPQESYDLISPYFVPRRRDAKEIRAMAKRGIRVRVLTNSLSASDTPIVHTGYAWQRHALIRAGVAIYEYSGDGKVQLRRGLIVRNRHGTAPFTRNKLHAKLFSVDRKRVFIGTFNFDPRSLFLNTEMGVVVEDPAWAEDLHRTFDRTVPDLAWRVGLRRGHLIWTRRTEDGGEETIRHEPGAQLWQRGLIVLLAWLPIKGLL
ncbi:phospholipase D family protein [Sedimentimonas flavescens]|uniref:Phospholipase D n=1 Tax=Sedimentimonas flavescens TaxID=2851012 RepID=A0ABT3A2X4_9RHOB|nr:phospholipase D family protein [Sedimentimonas flavescens]MCV2880288.1 phospholipase D family protein [Sedimentimonas flavescens]